MSITAIKKGPEQYRTDVLARIEARLAGLNGHARTPGFMPYSIGRDKFAEMEFPGRKDEDWKYTPVKPFLTRSYGPETHVAATTELDIPNALTLELGNGRLMQRPDALPDGVYIGSWEDFASQPDNEALTEPILSKLSGESMSVFESMALGLSPDITFIHITANTALRQPVVLHHTNFAEGDHYVGSNAYTLVVVDRLAECQLVELFSGDNSRSYFTNSAIRFYLDEGSRLTHYRLQTESMGAHHISNCDVVQQRDSTYGIYVGEFGGERVRNNMSVRHEGENITSNIYGAFIARGKQHIDTQSFIDHAEPNCESNELFKGVLLEYGRGVFNGKIIVRPDAQKTNAFQQNAALVLSPHATIDSKPQLEIFADDVRCSHGATIGQLDQEQVFYLKSRGLSHKAAESLLKRAFLTDVISKIPDEDMLAVFESALETELESIQDNE